jgi:hypothetical protein
LTSRDGFSGFPEYRKAGISVNKYPLRPEAGASLFSNIF